MYNPLLLAKMFYFYLKIVIQISNFIKLYKSPGVYLAKQTCFVFSKPFFVDSSHPFSCYRLHFNVFPDSNPVSSFRWLCCCCWNFSDFYWKSISNLFYRLDFSHQRTLTLQIVVESISSYSSTNVSKPIVRIMVR